MGEGMDSVHSVFLNWKLKLTIYHYYFINYLAHYFNNIVIVVPAPTMLIQERVQDGDGVFL